MRSASTRPMTLLVRPAVAAVSRGSQGSAGILRGESPRVAVRSMMTHPHLSCVMTFDLPPAVEPSHRSLRSSRPDICRALLPVAVPRWLENVKWCLRYRCVPRQGGLRAVHGRLKPSPLASPTDLPAGALQGRRTHGRWEMAKRSLSTPLGAHHTLPPSSSPAFGRDPTCPHAGLLRPDLLSWEGPYAS